MRKLASRKLWAAMAGLISGLSMVFGLDENVFSAVAGAVVSASTVITYIITEGKVDAAHVNKAAEQTNAALEVISHGDSK